MKEYNLSRPASSLNQDVHVFEGLIPHETQRFLDIGLQVFTLIPIGLFGLVANFVNILIFWKQGLRDSANLLFLVLSCSDLGVVLVTLTVSCIFSTMALAPGRVYVVDLRALRYTLAWPRIYFVDCSMYTTVLLAVVRCLCVVKPLTFKRTFTSKRTFLLVCAVYIPLTAMHLGIFVGHRLQLRFDKNHNRSRWLLYVSDAGRVIEDVHHYVSGISFTMINVLIIIVSSIIMVSVVKASTKFRMGAAAGDGRQKDLGGEGRGGSEEGKISSLSSRTLSRDAKLVQMVTLVSAIFVACYVPVIAHMLARQIEPEIDMFRRYHNLNTTGFSILYVVADINASVNIFVYYAVSTKYREVFHDTFCGGKEKRVDGGRLQKQRG